MNSCYYSDLQILENQLQISKFSGYENFTINALNKKIAIFGIGGSGCSIALTLARIGIYDLVLIDKDIVEPKNLSRQVLYGVEDIGRSKSMAAKDSIQFHSFRSNVTACEFDICKEEKRVQQIIEDSDFVFNLVDEDLAIAIVSKYCRIYRKSSIFFGTDPISGMMVRILLQKKDNGACIKCLNGIHDTVLNLKRKNKSNHGSKISGASWCPTPEVGAGLTATMMMKELCDIPINYNFISCYLYLPEIQCLSLQGIPGCEICGQ